MEDGKGSGQAGKALCACLKGVEKTGENTTIHPTSISVLYSNIGLLYIILSQVRIDSRDSRSMGNATDNSMSSM
jgi:hypothetical protein